MYEVRSTKYEVIHSHSWSYGICCLFSGKYYGICIGHGTRALAGSDLWILTRCSLGSEKDTLVMLTYMHGNAEIRPSLWAPRELKRLCLKTDMNWLGKHYLQLLFIKYGRDACTSGMHACQVSHPGLERAASKPSGLTVRRISRGRVGSVSRAMVRTREGRAYSEANDGG